MNEQKEHVKYKILAHIVELHLNKNISFQTKITWKRNVNKTQTQTVTHQNCVSTFDQTLELELNLVFNQQSNQFESKLTEFAVVVIYQGKIKSGGSVRYDIADVINNNYNNERVQLKLNQCPDPNAYLEIVFDYQVLGQTSRSLFNQLSMLNASGMENDLSQIDFKDNQKENGRRQSEHSVTNDERQEKQNMSDMPLREKELSKINNILDKFQNVSRRLGSSPKTLNLSDQNSTKLSNLEISEIATEQEHRLQARINQLEQQLQLKNSIIEDYEQKLQASNRQVQELQLKLELIEAKNSELQSEIKSLKIDEAIKESEENYKELYHNSLKQIEELKNNADSDNMNFSKQSNNFNKFVEQVYKIQEVPEFEVEDSPKENKMAERLNELQKQNIDLETKIAMSTHRIAQLFNAAYDFGGAKLLDYLQNSIGLIEQSC